MTGLQMKYFVLKPAGDSAYSKASRAAMRAYAEKIKSENPELSDELLSWETVERHKAAGLIEAPST
ncbi:MAG: hypothetical protein JJ902_04160 [Roseibium sp.]|nr:hypothetical protein [Roseibium sp.]